MLEVYRTSRSMPTPLGSNKVGTWNLNFNDTNSRDGVLVRDLSPIGGQNNVDLASWRQSASLAIVCTRNSINDILKIIVSYSS